MKEGKRLFVNAFCSQASFYLPTDRPAAAFISPRYYTRLRLVYSPGQRIKHYLQGWRSRSEKWSWFFSYLLQRNRYEECFISGCVTLLILFQFNIVGANVPCTACRVIRASPCSISSYEIVKSHNSNAILHGNSLA